MKKALLGILLLLLLPLTCSAETGVRGYIKNDGYQYVIFGEYPYEKDGTAKPLLWRILDVTDNQALLLTEDVIDARQVIFETDERVIEKRTYRRIASYAESDLYTWMNTEGLDQLLGDAPEREALIAEPGGGEFFILNSDQFLTEAYGFAADRWNEQVSRQAVATPYARAQGTYKDHSNGKSPYWVSTLKSETDYRMQLVGYNGHLSFGAYTRVNVGLRPSVRLDLSKLRITGGDGSMESPFRFAYQASPEEMPENAAADAPTPLQEERAHLQLPIVISYGKGD